MKFITVFLPLDPNNDAARIELAGLFFRAEQYANCAKTSEENTLRIRRILLKISNRYIWKHSTKVNNIKKLSKLRRDI